MLLRLGKIAVVLSLFCLVDGHLGSLQCVAWANMIKERSADAESLPKLVVETVSGAKPCEPCRSIQEQSHEEKQSEGLPLPDKPTILISFARQQILLTPPVPGAKPFERGSFQRKRPHPPLERPPRTLA